MLSSAEAGFSRRGTLALESDLGVCREVLQQSQSSFRFAFFLLPRAERDALSAVYAFCRAADDIADDAGAKSPQDRLDAWRREIDRAFAGRPAHAIGRALAWAVDSFALPRQPFDDLIDGVVTDLSVSRYETAEALEQYC
ncbi:MAG: squalene/phytoene synthase family protein [bacterium]